MEKKAGHVLITARTWVKKAEQLNKFLCSLHMHENFQNKLKQNKQSCTFLPKTNKQTKIKLNVFNSAGNSSNYSAPLILIKHITLNTYTIPYYFLHTLLEGIPSVLSELFSQAIISNLITMKWMKKIHLLDCQWWGRGDCKQV